eukprot:CAMPEP_0196772444 /NCGR_PEP_ID=MMETSP1104-20130614/2235_1 /TAXON_ID=33652 /ORGANISM="Cafeteria sp., Strain Caron Lab Isolate" /LENGTH=143 /DNA_ID=CAMNT_0042142579 /DNA_START=69 /DNA_END=497 /DNA_ORIENTATION=+
MSIPAVESAETADAPLVEIPEYQVHHDPNKGSDFAVYVIRTTICDDVWTAFRRYTHFLSFHSAMRDRFAKEERQLPTLPPKRAVGNMHPAFINARAVALERYMRAVVRELPADPEVTSFLGIGTASTHEAKLTSFPWTFRTGG